MAGSVKVKINRAGARAVLNSPGVIADIDRRAKAIAAAANAFDEHLSGTDFRGDARAGRNRAHGGVIAVTRNAVYHDRKHNILLKSLQAGGG